MFVSATARNAIKRAHIARYHCSAKCRSEEPGSAGHGASASRSRSEWSLPDHKLRALISLYHESKSFITPHNLEQEIYKTFVDRTERLPSTDYVNFYDLRDQVADRRLQPKFGEPENGLVPNPPSYAHAVSEKVSERANAVLSALYGASGPARPGLELLEETWEQVEEKLKQHEEEMQQPRDSNPSW